MYDIFRTVNTARRLVKTVKAAPKQAKQTHEKFKAADNKKRFWMIAKITGLVALVLGVWIYRESRKVKPMAPILSDDDGENRHYAHFKKWGTWDTYHRK